MCVLSQWRVLLYLRSVFGDASLSQVLTKMKGAFIIRRDKYLPLMQLLIVLYSISMYSLFLFGLTIHLGELGGVLIKHG